MKTPAAHVLAALLVAVPALAGDQPLLSKHRAALAGLEKKDAKGAWLVGDDALAAVKKDFAALLKLDAADLGFVADKDSGSAVIGEAVAGRLKTGRAYFVVDAENRKLVAEAAILSGRFADAAGREKLLSIVFFAKDITYKTAVGTKLCEGATRYIRDGSIIADVSCPDGEKLVIRRQKGDDATLTVNQIPFKTNVR